MRGRSYDSGRADHMMSLFLRTLAIGMMACLAGGAAAGQSAEQQLNTRIAGLEAEKASLLAQIARLEALAASKGWVSPSSDRDLISLQLDGVFPARRAASSRAAPTSPATCRS